MLLNRRLFTQGLFTSSLLLPLTSLTAAPARAAPATTQALTATNRVLEVNGKSATVYGLLRPDGKQGLEVMAEDQLDLTLTNRLADPTLIHWHGLTPALEYDGVPDHPLPMLKSGEARLYHLPTGLSGTHWMHAHTLQEQQLLAAPLIVRSKADLARDEQEVVILLHDFSFKSPEELLSQLTNGMMNGHAPTDPSPAMNPQMDHGMMMNHNMMDLQLPPHGVPPLKLPSDVTVVDMSDVNDLNYDAYLANDRTLSDPEVIRVEKSGRVRLRIINGASSTNFTIDTGQLDAQVIAVDGQDIVPIAATRWPLAMGQRVDLRVQIPKAGGAFAILALREGDVAQTGVILASQGSHIAKLPDSAKIVGPLLTLDQEATLQSLRALAIKAADRKFAVKLQGTMHPYQWQMVSDAPLQIKKGERIEVTMINDSMMSHPMHLHGHHFQVIAINGIPLSQGGALRDTVLVPPQAQVTIAFDAENPSDYWAFHCHHLYHMVTGMMTNFSYQVS